jgi:DNA-directed RNA polymerase specialized sigma24 family protein
MKKDWVLTQDAFDTLLGWLDPDRDRAGRRYEDIRIRLIKIFTCRGCSDAEELADETINRVIAKMPDVAENYSGDPALYFYGVSHNVHLEYSRKSRLTGDTGLESASLSANVASPDTESDAEYECLDRCLGRLSPESRRLVLEYYRHERKAKIDLRKRLAGELGIAVNALRIRAYRIRRTLEDCVHGCLQQQPAH